ncbi:unnamed protein product [Rotaria magnacalcarata]|uniref:HAT C-terminal dimerisation domain-containing protein n=2 Tax=Rotaria magnacalcarata TaxID=392030 RepID=A0A816YI80_9BILA|nr:unnamed protein product [Rotaria magnacalcarata]
MKLQIDTLSDPLVIQSVLSTITHNKQNNKMRKTTHSINTLDEIFDVPHNEDNTQQQPLDRIEFDRYLQDETGIDNNTNILTYWHLNKSTYPNLAPIAKRILAIPATNTTIERLFPNSGNIITDLRTQLDTKKLVSAAPMGLECGTHIYCSYDEVKENQIQGIVVYANKLQHYAFIKRLDKKGEPNAFAREVSINTKDKNPRFMISDKCTFILIKVRKNIQFLQLFLRLADRGYEAFNINIEKRSLEKTRNNKITKI